ncbi:MAG: hypothetical protein HDQ99_02680 [Lachnospiraceae bacterium]|nr:hypothetical protein [Lachnospiraceae bacterium]
MKIKFCNINEIEIAIHFTTQTQLEKFVDYLKAYGYDYGTGGSNIDEIKGLGVRYFGENNQYLTLDRSKTYHSRNYCSCGKGYRATLYDFKDIDWNVA